MRHKGQSVALRSLAEKPTTSMILYGTLDVFGTLWKDFDSSSLKKHFISAEILMFPVKSFYKGSSPKNHIRYPADSCSGIKLLLVLKT